MLPILALPFACSGPPSGPASPAPTPAPTIEVSVDAFVASAVEARWAGQVAEVRVVFHQGDERRTACAHGDVGSLRMPLLQLGVPVDWTAELVGPDGTAHQATGRVVLPDAPPLPEFRLTDLDPARSELAGGMLLLSHLDRTTDQSFAVVVDGAGRPRFAATVPLERRITRARLSGDGRSVLFAHYPRDLLANAAAVTRIPLDGGPAVETHLEDQHHDFVELPDGEGFAWLSFESERREVGGDLLPVMADRVLLGPEAPSAAPPTTLFSFQRDYPVDPWWTCGHMTRGFWVEDHNEWTHSNSLVATEDGGFLVLARNLDGLVRLDRDGAMRWQLGGRDGTLRILGDEGFSHPHFSWAEGDRVLVFDNAVHSDEKTRVVEYAIDEEAGTAELVWELFEPQGRFVGVMGDATRLPGGNTLVSLAARSQLFEVTPAGEVVAWMDLVSTEPEDRRNHTVHRLTFAADLDGPWTCDDER